MDLGWLSGILEGEGSFGLTTYRTKLSRLRYPLIQLAMTDRDIVERVATHWGHKTISIRQDSRKVTYKPIFRVSQSGVPALVTMLEVFPWMGLRRRQKIESVLSTWEHTFSRPPGRPKKGTPCQMT